MSNTTCTVPPCFHNFSWQSRTYPCLISRTITMCSVSCGSNEIWFLVNSCLIPAAAVNQSSPSLLPIISPTSDAASSSSCVFCSTCVIFFPLRRESACPCSCSPAGSQLVSKERRNHVLWVLLRPLAWDHLDEYKMLHFKYSLLLRWVVIWVPFLLLAVDLCPIFETFLTLWDLLKISDYVQKLPDGS